MASLSDGTASSAPSLGVFATTHWSVVLAAGQGESSQAAEALEKLCGAYWYPLYAYVRRCGYGPEDAQDVTQEFFARLLAKDYLAREEIAQTLSKPAEVDDEIRYLLGVIGE